MLEKLITYYTGGNKAKFAKKINIKPQALSMWISRNSFDPQLLYTKCEGISAEWLLTGEGEMLRSAEGGNVTSTTDNRSNSDNLTFSGHNNQVINSSCGRDIINGSDSRQDAADERIRLLEELLKEKERTIQILLGQINKSDKSNNN